jgi:Protein of unknown function (DUF3352)
VRRASIAILATATAVLLAACGSSSTSSGESGGAAVAPGSSAAFVRVNTDLGSPQWQSLAALVKLLPSAGSDLLSSLADVTGAVGPETDAAALTPAELGAGKNLVGLTQPRSVAKLKTLLAKQDPPLVSEDVAGWQVVAAQLATIDRFKRARNDGVLADDGAYKDATEGLPADALVTAYATGEAVTAAVDRQTTTQLGPIPGIGRVSWASAALTTAQGGFEVQARVKGDEIEPYEYTAELPAQVPAPVSLLVDAKGLNATLDELRRSPLLTGQLGTIAKAAGPLLDGVIELFKGEAALYVRPLPRGPEYTLVLLTSDEEAARNTLDGLATLAGAVAQAAPEHLTVQGVKVTKITVQKTALYYAVFDGKVVVTSAPSGIRGLVLNGPRLTATRGWQRASAAVGLPKETAGIVYGDAATALPLLAKLTGDKAQQSAKLPFGTGLAYASVDGSVLSVKGYIGVR